MPILSESYLSLIGKFSPIGFLLGPWCRMLHALVPFERFRTRV
jgi:hypothetical protein